MTLLNCSIITLHRPPENSPNPVQQHWDGELLEFKVFKSRQAELSYLVERIKVNLVDEGLKLTRQIVLPHTLQTMNEFTCDSFRAAAK